MQILCVDDNPLVLSVTADLLRELGHQVLEASDGEAALTRLRRAGFAIDLLLTDIAMPGMDGATLASRARISVPGLPVVYMTGLPVEPRGGDPVLTKPCSLGSLSDAISLADERSPRTPGDDHLWHRLH